MEIKEYKEYKEDDIKRLYTEVGWSAYTEKAKYPDVRQMELITDNTPKTVAFYKSLGFYEFSEIGCCGFMRG